MDRIIDDIKQMEYPVRTFMTRFEHNKKLFSKSLDHYLQGSGETKARELEELMNIDIGLKPKKNLTVDELVLALNKRAEVISDVNNESISGPYGFYFLDVLDYNQCYLKYGREQEDIEDAKKRFQEDPLVVEATKNLEKAFEVRGIY